MIDYSRLARLPTAPLEPIRLARSTEATTMVLTALCAAIEPHRSRQVNQEPT